MQTLTQAQLDVVLRYAFTQGKMAGLGTSINNTNMESGNPTRVEVPTMEETVKEVFTSLKIDTSLDKLVVTASVSGN